MADGINDDPLQAATPDTGTPTAGGDAAPGPLGGLNSLSLDNTPAPGDGGLEASLPSPVHDLSQLEDIGQPSSLGDGLLGDVRAAVTPYTVSVEVGEATDREGTFFFPVRTYSAGNKEEGKVVYRRYREIQSLNSYLHKEFEGYFLPDMPPKDLISAAGRMFMMKTSEETQADMRARQLLIQGYLTPMANHPEISKSEAMKLFFSADNLSSDPQWMYLVPPAKNAIMRVVNAGKEDIQTLMRKIIDRYEPDSTAPEDEIELHQMLMSMQELFAKLSMLETSTNAMLAAHKEDADAAANLGCDLTKLFKHTEECTTTALPQHSALFGDPVALARTQDVGKACVAVRNATFHSVRRSKGFVDSCHEILQDGFMHKQLLGGLLGAFEARQSALAKLVAARKEREELSARESLLAENDASLAAQKTRNALAAAEAGVTVAETTYGRIKERNLYDLARLKGQREIAFEAMLLKFSEANAAFQSEIAERWVRAAAALGAPAAECSRLRACLPGGGANFEASPTKSAGGGDFDELPL